MLSEQGKPLSEFISKASTLQKLSKLLKKSSIEKLFVFTHREWILQSQEVIDTIKKIFTEETIIIRSSALSEDTINTSNAGSFTSVLHIDSKDADSIKIAINDILASYRKKGAENFDNPILVQSQTLNVEMSGTILTRDYNGAPYYVINYSEDDTTSVTSGQHSKCVKILKSENVIIPNEFSRLIEAIKEIEGMASGRMPLDIEFGIKHTGDIITFQVRPLVASAKTSIKDSTIFARINNLKHKFIALSKRRKHLAGEITYFGDMPDWNPAEIIGNSPHILAASLYDEIITNRVWHEARTSQGYIDVNPAKLVLQFGNKPYVDVRSTFNSFVPASIPKQLREKMLRFYLNKLKVNPQLQDKVEFEILFTCYDISFNKRSKELQKAGFSEKEIKTIKAALLDLTNNLLTSNTITRDLQANEELDKYRKSLSYLPKDSPPQQHIDRAIDLLRICKEKGTLQFSRLARLAFTGKTILKSLEGEGLIDSKTYYFFLESINTVASQFAIDLTRFYQGKLHKNTFMGKYGHLRPGTYDITVPRYDMSDDYFSSSDEKENTQTIKKQEFVLEPSIYRQVSKILKEHQLTVNAQELFEFIHKAIEAREYSKFLFSRCLSEAIESIAHAGASLGFSRDDLANLDTDAIKAVTGKDSEYIIKHWNNCIRQNKLKYELNSFLSLPPVIFSESDFEIISYYESRPNYITNKKIQGKIILLDEGNQDEITGKIVVLESADPGHDWIFTKNPMALITKYGGPASHMAIRCAELGLPAIIGAGEMLYDIFLNTRSVALDCENGRVEPKGKLH